MKRLIDEIEDSIEPTVRMNDNHLITCGFDLSIKEKAGTVQWKTEYIKEMGKDAAEKLVQDAPKKEELVIEKL